MAPLIVHHLNHSRSLRILWLLEELGLEYEVKFYPRAEGSGDAPEEVKKLHPLGKLPLLQHGDHIVAETGAIFEYVIEFVSNSKLGAPRSDVKLYTRYLYWLHFAEGTLLPPTLISFFLQAAGNDKETQDKLSWRNNKLNLDFLEGELGKSKWFLGSELSAADIILSFPIEGLEVRYGFEGYPNLKAWVEAIHKRPAYKVALEKGGGQKEYDLGFFKRV